MTCFDSQCERQLRIAASLAKNVMPDKAAIRSEEFVNAFNYHDPAPLPGGLYLFLYTVVVAFAMVRNALSAPYRWLIRPRLVVYAWCAAEIFLQPGTLNYALWGFSAILAVNILTGFIAIRRKI